MKKFLAILLCSTMILSSRTYAMGETPPTPTPTPTPVVEAPKKPEPPFHLKAKLTFTPQVDGWFFTDQQEQKMRFRLIDADYLEKKLQLTEDNLQNYKVMFEEEQKITEKYRKAWLESDETLTTVLKREGRTKLYYTILGVLLTVGAGFAIGYAAKAVK